MVKLGYVDIGDKRVDTYAYFNDGRIVLLYQPLRKYFFKKFKSEMEQTFGMQFEDITDEVKQENELSQ